MATAGARNLITDVAGILVGQAEDGDRVTGTTVVLAEAPAVASVDVRGGAPGTRETELLGADALVDRVDAVVLSGGSAFGLDAAAGVMEWLAAAGRGFAVGSTLRSPLIRVPIVPAAVLFDLGFPGQQIWSGEPPFRALGRSAVGTAAKDFAQGNAGAGLGARAGQLKGGIGSASLTLADGVAVGAIVAVNSFGSALRPGCGRFWAADLALPGDIDPQPPLPDTPFELAGFRGMQSGRRRGQHDDRGRRHRRGARQGRVPASGDHGAGRAGPRDPPDPHPVRRRHRVRAGDRNRAAGRTRAIATTRQCRGRLLGAGGDAGADHGRTIGRRAELAPALDATARRRLTRCRQPPADGPRGNRPEAMVGLPSGRGRLPDCRVRGSAISAKQRRAARWVTRGFALDRGRRL